MNAILTELERECPALVEAIGTDIQNPALYELVDYLEALSERETPPVEDDTSEARWPVYTLINLEASGG